MAISGLTSPPKVGGKKGPVTYDVLQLPSLENQRQTANRQKIRDIMRNTYLPSEMKFTDEEIAQVRKERQQMWDKNPDWKKIVGKIAFDTAIDQRLLQNVLTDKFVIDFGDKDKREQLAAEIYNHLRNDEQLQEKWRLSRENKELREEKGDWISEAPEIGKMLENTIVWLYQHNKLVDLKMLKHLPYTKKEAAMGLVPEDEDPENYKAALLKESGRSMNINHMLVTLLEMNPAEWKTRGYNGDRDALRGIQDMVLNAQNAYASNIISAQDYQKVINDGLTELMALFDSTKYKDFKNETQITKASWEIKSAEELKFFNIARRKVLAEAAKIKNPKMQNYVRTMFDRIKKDMKEGIIDVTEAYERMNGLSHIARESIEAKPTYAVTDPRKSKHVVMTGAQEDVNRDLTQYYRDARNSGLFAFPFIDLSRGMGGKRNVTRNIYDLSPKEKNSMLDDVQNLLKALPDLQNTVSQDYATKGITMENVQKLLADFRQFLPRTNELKHVMFMDKMPANKKIAPKDAFRYGFPVLSRAITAKDIMSLNIAADQQLRKDMIADLYRASVFVRDLNNWLQTFKDQDTSSIPTLRKKLRAVTLPALERNAEDIVIDPTKKYTDVRIHERKEKKTRYVGENAKIAWEGEQHHKAAVQQLKDKQYTFDNIRYGDKPRKEYAESLKTEYDHSVEYNVKTDEDLIRMKSEIAKMDGKLYIIDLATGRLHPIQMDQVFKGAVYVFKKNTKEGNAKGGAFALNVVKDRIHMDQHQLLPYEFMRNGNDKNVAFFHKLPNKIHTPDWRNQMRDATGGGMWSWVKKKVNDSAKHYVQGVKDAGNSIAKGTKSEFNNFVKQETRNARNIYQSSSNLIRNPSWSSFSNAAVGVGKLGLQPIVSGARTTATLLDATNKIPGLNMVKYGAEWALPPLAIVDGLSHAVKSSGYGSQDPADYLKAVTNLGDALLGSGKLSGAVDTSARILNTSGKIADYFHDK